MWQTVRSKPGNSDPDTSRYHELAHKAKLGTDVAEDSTAVYSFMEAEASVQLKRLLDLLKEIRDVCDSINLTNA